MTQERNRVMRYIFNFTLELSEHGHANLGSTRNGHIMASPSNVNHPDPRSSLIMFDPTFVNFENLGHSQIRNPPLLVPCGQAVKSQENPLAPRSPLERCRFWIWRGLGSQS